MVSQADRRQIELKRRRLLKGQLIIESGGRCQTCGQRPDFKDGRGELHLSHIISISRGGKTEGGNVLVECRKCHNKRHGIKEVL